jgi:hypothetical protein
MKARTCSIHVWISNDKGEKACYSLKPLPPDQFGQAAAAFRLTKLNCDPAPIYAVYVRLEGAVVCTCAQFHMTAKCKHSSALVASGVLPVGLLATLRDRTQLLNHAEAEVLRVTEAAVEERQLHDHDCEWRANRIADLNEQIERLEAELEARKPKPRRRRAPAKVAA